MVIGERLIKDVVQVRKALLKDAVTIASIQSNTLKVAYKDILPRNTLKKITFSQRLTYFKDVLETKNEENVVAVFNDVVVGFMTFGNTRDEHLDGQAGEIWGLYVDVNHFNKGIGKTLIYWVEQEFIKQSKDTVYLWVLKENERARIFFESLGYILEGKSENLSCNQEFEVVRYYKELDVLS